ncbi:FecR family protein [Pedobacter punctiformis]|uniref:FecR family protein n=1 Tax=Pedobacter punctiformis TaxID=3004097 RepID=A0ABT4LBC7_9SPHI|nr:FecR family protein [Pedobacter sp. HCMS5-2]MCZ4245220.1 FecR family protein [Pedobacter sp. HCMS5-2]
MEKRINHLLNQFQADTLNNAEKQELLELADAENELVSKEIIPMIMQEEQSAKQTRVEGNWENVLQNVLATDKPQKLKRRTLIPILRWAAAIIVLIAVSITVYIKSYNPTQKVHVFVQDVLPGGNKAILTLADGKKISLTDAVTGDIAKQSGLSITKAADGQLIYKVSEVVRDADDSKVNTISTPRGGQWQVRLPDGSVVWLNAESSLTYPLSFASAKQRIVQLTGEAYFEVTKDKLHPFIVRTAKQEVEVLGTHFNINCYADEDVTKTTLLEGSVRVFHNNTHDTEVLKPGEQSVLSNNGINVRNTDVEESIAWKNGYFMFDNEKQESIMRKLSRWYNVDVKYADASAKEVMYYGTVSRFGKVSQVLRKLEQTGEVRFDIKDNKIIVYKEDKKK